MAVNFDDESTGVSYQQYPKDPLAREQISILDNKVEQLKEKSVSKQEIIDIENKVRQSDLDKENFKEQVNTEVTNIKGMVEGLDGGNLEKITQLETQIGGKANKDLVDNLYNQIEDKASAESVTQLTSQLADKATKAEVRRDTASQPINVSEMDTETKKLFTGGAVAVVGENSIGDENIKVNAITSTKRTVLGDTGFLFSGNGYIDFDFVNNKIIFPALTFAIVRNVRYQISEAALEIPIPTASGSYAVYYDTIIKQVSLLNSSNSLGTVTENQITLATLRRGTTNLAWALGKYKINGKMNSIEDEEIKSIMKTAAGEFGMVLTSNGYVNIDFLTSTIVFPNITYVFHRNKRYTLTTGTNLIVDFPTGTGSFVIFLNVKTSTIRVIDGGSVVGALESEILIGTIRRGTVNGAWMAGAYKIDGNLFGFTQSGSPSGITINSRWQGKKANFLGDSITHGTPRVTDSKNIIHNVIKDTLGLSEARNYGVSGTAIAGDTGGNVGRDFATRYIEMDNDADLIFVFGGVNDYGLNLTTPFGTMSDRTTGSFYGGLHVLINGLTTKYPTQTIIFMTPIHKINSNGSYDNNPNTNTGKTLKEYGDAIKEVCSFYGIPCIDGFSIGLSPMNSQQVQTMFYEKTAPITHPNDIGSQFLGKAIAARLIAL